MYLQDLVRQMEREQALVSRELSADLTEELNSTATQRAADRVAGASGGWPYPPDRDMLRFYRTIVDNAWRRRQRNYAAFKVDLSIRADRGANPAVEATAVYNTTPCGGQTYMMQPKDTVVSVARRIYGSDAYAAVVWEANARVLGRQCRIVPAGFGIELPLIRVPDWRNPPRLPIPPGATSPAVRVMYPGLEMDLQTSRSATQVVDLGPLVLEITLEVTGKMKAQRKGTLDASFNLRSYEASASRSLGPISGGYRLNVRTMRGQANLVVTNSSISGLNMTTTVGIKEGGLNVTFGSRKVRYTSGDWVFEGQINIGATVRVYPKKVRATAPARAPARSPARSSARSPSPANDVNWGAVAAIVVIGVAFMVVGGLVIAGSGGTAAPGVAVAGEEGMALAITALAPAL